VERRGDRAADAAAVPVGVGEAVPVDLRGLEATDEYPRGPVGSGCDRRAGLRDDSPEGFIFGNFYRQYVSLTVLERAPGPQDHTIRIWIARGHPFAIKIPAFTPPNARRVRSTAPRQRRAKRNCSPHEVAAAQRHLLPPSQSSRVYFISTFMADHQISEADLRPRGPPSGRAHLARGQGCNRCRDSSGAGVRAFGRP